MDITSIRLLKSLLGGEKETGRLPEFLGIKDRQVSYIIKKLAEQDYIEREDTTIRLKETPKAILLRDIAQTMDVEILLCKSNEKVLASIDKGITIDRLTRRTGLSKTTIYRSISDLQSTGAIIKEDDATSIDESKEQLALFVKLLKTERQRYEDGETEIIYNDDSMTLRKTPNGKVAKGVTTGFTLFSEYGMEYRTTHDYFCQQDGDLDMQDVLLHAILAANHSRNKMELLIAILFYAKHKDMMDVLQLRKKASGLGISGVWLDIEAYMRKKRPKNADLFLPWDEFLSKAELYDVPIERHTLPRPGDSLFQEISDGLEEPRTIYLFGGENMRIKSLKDSTKDCDIVVETGDDFEDLARVLTGIGYERRSRTSYSDEDRRIRPSDIFEHGQKGRVDLFTSTIMQKLSLSPAMMKRADIRDYGRLKIGLLRNEDVFLLKAMAGREGDIQDMASLVKGSPGTPHELHHGSFDWESVWSEMQRQEHINREDFTVTVFEQMTYLAEQTGIAAPFLDKLRRHVINKMIKRVLRGGSMQIREIVELLKGRDITESMIRNRIDALERTGIIEKHSAGRATHVQLVKDGEYPEK